MEFLRKPAKTAEDMAKQLAPAEEHKENEDTFIQNTRSISLLQRSEPQRVLKELLPFSTSFMKLVIIFYSRSSWPLAETW
ncbi:hypothetical protein Ngar_c27150 [Candidatus Nitrososphaera gargensis Ga9.2]|uniref:Uncharacterized protein n=2 Tax=Candidatus Nitrososphaera gargensis TaxID=497727 RepID=K0IE51_NITGG|nr:hypothetical protein Ngar_c27150 [Candidatus Nitrososphaera gargensis Ga9.2]